MLRLGILGSTRGTHLLTLLTAIEKKELSARIEVVLSNKEEALILEKARSANIANHFVSAKDLSREAFDATITALLKKHEVDLIILIGYMRILSADFVAEWKNKIINVHPSLLPNFAGKMDLDVHRAVVSSGAKETGCTVHYVTEEVDAGPIVLQKKCAVLANDTAETLKARVQALEGEALIAAVSRIRTS